MRCAISASSSSLISTPRPLPSSPKDYRWSMVLARTQTNLEDYPAAIETYGKSIAIRPDRSDLYISRAELEERLMRFDDAAADYEHIYQLAYKDPQWMEKLAAVRARQGKTNEVVAALQAALDRWTSENREQLLRGCPPSGILGHARPGAEILPKQGVTRGAADFLANGENHDGVKTYVRIMTRLRQHEQAYAVLQKALEDAKAELPVLKEQVEKKGITGLTDAQWRENVREKRIETARNGVTTALQEMGNAVNTYFTPEERLAFAQFRRVETKRHESRRLGQVRCSRWRSMRISPTRKPAGASR